MRLALLMPSYWPEVRHGSERLVHDLGVVMARRGHEVTLITTHPGAREVRIEEGVRVIRARRLPSISPLRRYEDHLTAIPATLAEVDHRRTAETLRFDGGPCHGHVKRLDQVEAATRERYLVDRTRPGSTPGFRWQGSSAWCGQSSCNRRATRKCGSGTWH